MKTISGDQTQRVLADLRHLYNNMINGAVRDTASAKRIAICLLGPAISRLEGSETVVVMEDGRRYEGSPDA